MLLVTSFFSLLDVVTIDKTGENFRLLYDIKGRFTVHRIMPEEAKVTLTSSVLFRARQHSTDYF